jgi:glyoxylase-like metal-dependent hydrolase (beta-lactamase superfamily II)
MTDEFGDGVTVLGDAQRKAWLRRELPPVEKVAEGLWSIPVPMPDSPLRYVSVYALADDSEVILIDAGWDDEAAWTALTNGLAALGASMADVGGCLVTHQHFDHIGLARRVRDASGAWVGLHPADRDAIMRPDFRDPTLALAEDRRWLAHLGAPAAEISQIWPADRAETDPRSGFVIPDRLVENGDVIAACGRQLTAVHTPGHTPGHLCFVDESGDALFSGDHVLPRISPNISMDGRRSGDPLGDYLRSLVRIAEHRPTTILPAHEWRFSGLDARVAQLIDHHLSRLEELLRVIAERPGIAPWDMAAHLTWSRPWDQYGGLMRVMAVSETMAHVEYLHRRGFVSADSARAPGYTVTGHRDDLLENAVRVVHGVYVGSR